MSELFQFFLDSDTTSGNSIQTGQTQERPGMASIEWECEMGLTGVMHGGIRSGDGSNERPIVP